MTLELKKALDLIEGEIAVIAAKNPQLVVITTPRRIPPEFAERLRETWQLLTLGTALEGIKVLLLEDGMEMSIVDQVDHHTGQSTTDE